MSYYGLVLFAFNNNYNFVMSSENAANKPYMLAKKVSRRALKYIRKLTSLNNTDHHRLEYIIIDPLVRYFCVLSTENENPGPTVYNPTQDTNDGPKYSMTKRWNITTSK